MERNYVRRILASVSALVVSATSLGMNVPNTVFAESGSAAKNQQQLLEEHHCDTDHEELCCEHEHDELYCEHDHDESCSDHEHEELIEQLDLEEAIAEESRQLSDAGTVRIALLDAGVTNYQVSERVSFVDDETIDSTHGNEMMGVLLAAAPEAEVFDVRVLDDFGNGTAANVTDGIMWAVSKNADIVVMSFAGAQDSSLYKEALDYAEENDVIVISAAGNESTDEPRFPAAYPTVISVGAWESEGTLWSASNYGAYVDTYEVSKYGTSGAAAAFAGKTAAALAENSEYTPALLRADMQLSKPAFEFAGEENADAFVVASACSHSFNGSYNTVSYPTCTENGKKVGKCNKCGAVVSTVILKALGHDWGRWKTVISAGCETEGLQERTCARCGDKESSYTSPRGHSFNGSYNTVSYPTCTEGGMKVGKCDKCGEVVSEVALDPLGHNWGKWTTVKESTCTEDGLRTRKCTRCDETDSETIYALGHTFNGSFETIKEPTCTEAGIKAGKCTKCGEIVSQTELKALGHDWGRWTTTKEPTCTLDGTRTRKCNRCGVSETAKASATGHTFNGSYNTTKYPTCTEGGMKVGKCDKCGEVVSKVQLDPLGHNWDKWTTVKEATCTKDGSRTRKCTRCDETETETVYALGHSFNGSYETVKEPTCSSKGLKVGKCTKCGDIVSEVRIPALEHKYGPLETVIEPTCSSTGLAFKYCTICNRMETVHLSARAHIFNGSYVVVKEPTCTEDGLKEGRCTVCGKVVSTVEIPAKGGSHTFNGSYNTVKQPTCSETGLKEGRCTKCGEVVSTAVIPKLEHDFGDWQELYSATCTTSGSRYRKCKNCSKIVFETITPTGHSFNGSYETTVEPTCTTPGERVGKCTKCGKVVSRYSIPATHKYGEWTIITNPTCGENGLKVHECTVCRKRETEVIPKSSEYHSFNGSFEVIPATCTEAGERIARCTKCGEILSSTTIPKKGGYCTFNGSFETVKEPTCTETGLKVGKCTKCAKVLQKIVIPKKDHTWSAWEVTSAGIRTHVCEVCGTSEEEQITEPAELEVEDCGYSEFYFTPDGGLGDSYSWPLYYANTDPVTLETTGLTYLKLSFNTNVDWTVSASSNIKVLDENGRTLTSGPAGENFILVALNSVDFSATGDEFGPYTLTINAKEESATYTLYQTNWYINGCSKEYFGTCDEITDALAKLGNYEDAIYALKGNVNTNGAIRIYETDGFRYLAVKTVAYDERNIALQYILYDATCYVHPETKNMKMDVLVLKANGLKITDNNQPMFSTTATMNGCYVNSTDTVYQEEVAFGNSLKVGIGTGAGLGLSFVPGGPLVGFTIGLAADTLVDVGGDALINVLTEDNGNSCVTTKTTVKLEESCVLDTENQKIGAYCDTENVLSPSCSISFFITDGANASKAVTVTS